MTRKLLAALGILFLAATAAPVRAEGIEGLYIGAAAGPSLSTWDFGNGDVDFSGPRGTLFLGYGVMVDRIYLGLEGGYGFGLGSVRARDDSLGLRLGVAERHEFTIAPRIGYMVKPGLVLFGSVGYQAAEIRGRLDAPGMGAYPLVGREHLDGLRLGVGMEASVTNNVFMRGEYTHTWFDGGDHHHQGRGPGSRGTATLGLGYRF